MMLATASRLQEGKMWGGGGGGRILEKRSKEEVKVKSW